MSEARSRKGRRSGVLRIYFIYIFVLALVMAGALGFLYYKLMVFQRETDAKKSIEAMEEAAKKVMAEEKKGPDPLAAQSAFEQYAASMDADAWTTLWQQDRPDDPESAEIVKAYFEEALAKDKPALFTDISSTEEEPVFKIKLGEKDLARVCMKKSSGDGSSAADWTVSGVDLLLRGDYEARAELPDGMQLICNGIAVAPSEEEVSHFPYHGIEELLENPVRWHECVAEGMLTEPEVAYSPADGYFYSEEDGCYLLPADDVPADLTERAEGFFRAYMVYTMTGGAGWKDYKAAKEEALAEGREAPPNPVMGRLNACCAYIPSDSEAYNMLFKAYDSTCYALAYTEQDCGLLETRGPIRWADNCVSVEFTYHAYANLNGQRKDYSGSDQLFRVFFIRKGDSWKIWAFSA
ncbi:MAG: hypothetical protein K6E50_15345 [Lachnospiraceae bacterium]|nr:hypothetical protein [Lachnospiraceae bacterium]